MRDGWMATGTGVGEVEVKSRDQDFQPTGVFRRQTISSITNLLSREQAGVPNLHQPGWGPEFTSTMEAAATSRPLDNVNPTIFAPTGSFSSRTQSAKALLWSEEAAEYQEFVSKSGSEGKQEEREEIDAEEVFGPSLGLPQCRSEGD